MASSNYELAKELWHSFYENVMYQQRYFVSHPMLDKLKDIASEMKKLLLNPVLYQDYEILTP